VLSKKEKQELREMAASEVLREEFRTMRRNSEVTERTLTVDELAHWLTIMAQICRTAPNPRPPVDYAMMKF
jgi:hypothetical protein